jgi:putative FmdB family regulatory protein
MPLYEYDCQACGRAFEALVFGSEKPECPACGSGKATKRFSAFAVTSGTREAPPAGGCGTCGDPRGPGSCSTS